MKKPKVLIIGDVAILLMNWQDELLKLGYDVEGVIDGEQAKAFMSVDFDVYLVDLFHVSDKGFQGSSGIHLISEIRQSKPNSLIIATTGYFREKAGNKVSTEEVVSELGVDHLLKKPFGINDLKLLIEAFMSKHD